MEMRSLGASGMQVSRLCFGTLTMGPMQRGFSPERGAALLTYAYARGFRFWIRRIFTILIRTFASHSKNARIA